MIKVAHILPSNIVNKEMVRQDYEMYLTDQVLKHKEQYSFLANDKMNGIRSYKILDNSACELGKGLTLDKILEAAKIIKADEIILPDILNSTESFDRTLEALSQLDIDKIKGTYKLAGVIQGDNNESIVKCILKLLSIKHINTIMIPKLYPDRIDLVALVLKLMEETHRTDIKIHLLGLKNEGITELMYGLIKDKVRSIDTGYFVAISNLKYKDVSIISPRPREMKINVETNDINQELLENRMKQVEKLLEM